MKNNLLNVSLMVLMFVCVSCVSSGGVEPVLGGGRSAASADDSAIEPSYRAPVAAARGGGDAAIRSELATVKADLRVAQEELQKLIFRIEILEKDNQAKDRQLAELQSLVGAMDGQFAAADKQWSERMESLRRNMESERAARQREMDNMSSAVAKEIASVKNSGRAAKASSVPANMKTIELTVQKGDNLGSIAKAANTTVKILKELNGLKGDSIYIGQKLKVPAN